MPLNRLDVLNVLREVYGDYEEPDHQQAATMIMKQQQTHNTKKNDCDCYKHEHYRFGNATYCVNCEQKVNQTTKI
jgi:hypothetical protein